MSRNLVYQLVVVAIVAAVGFWVVSATQANLDRLGVESGIDFLWRRAGFEISQSLIPFDANSTFARAFVVALLNTLVLALVAIVCSSVLGLVIGVSRLSSNWLVARLATAYVELFRNIPSLLQIFFWYFVVLRTLPRSRDSIVLADTVFLNNRGLFLPAPEFAAGGSWFVLALLVGIASAVYWRRRGRQRQYETGQRPKVWLPAGALIAGLPGLTLIAGITVITWDLPTMGRFSFEGGIALLPEFLALVVGLSMYNATYIGEIVRSGFLSIPSGQIEAADSLGLSRGLTVWLILFPQVLRVIIPPLTTVYLNLFKSTSLAAAIAYPEVVSVFVGTVNNLVGQPVVIMGITLLVYACISFCIALFMNWYNKRIALTAEA